LSTEPFWERPLPGKLLREFLELASTPFDFERHRDLWHSFEWSHIPSADDQYGIRLELPGGSWALIQPHGSHIGSYSAPVCYWENFDQASNMPSEAFRLERERYDRCYRALADAVTAVLGAPLETATETAPTCSYSIWRLAHALVIVQQAAFDVQFGIEVNLWLEPWEGPLPQIRPPLIDWLVKRDHDRATSLESMR
jgi:hypothetical protein